MRTNEFGHKLTKSKAQWLRVLRENLESGEIDFIQWGVHFRHTETYVECSDCADYLAGICPGGQDPISCFQDKRQRRRSQSESCPACGYEDAEDGLLSFLSPETE